MAIDKAWLDELVARTSLSALVGRAVTLKKAGREHKGCCPFHHEKTPSFTVNDDKGFYHCFGCGAHGDAIRWLVDHDGLPFIEAVKQLAEAAGMEVPARSPKAAERAARIDGIRPALDAAAAWYAHQLEQCGAAREYLSARGFGPDVVARFGLGWAPRAMGHVADIPGMTFEAARDSGLIWVDAESGRAGATFRERVMVPVHDARGRVIGFAARSLPGGAEPKYKNSPASEIFDKGRVLFNAHRSVEVLREARAALRQAQGEPVGGMADGRLLVVEGQFDALSLDVAGLAAVAPMGTALTAEQLTAAWRMDGVPVLLFDGDAAGRRAAVRAAGMALPNIAPGQSLAIALMPAGQDPDEVVRRDGRGMIDMIVGQARGLAGFVFDSVITALRQAQGERVGDIAADLEPEAVAGVWDRLAELGATIGHDELRAQYLADWRRRFEREVSLARVEVMREARDVSGGAGEEGKAVLRQAQDEPGLLGGEVDADRAEAEQMADEVAGRPHGEEGEERFRAMLRSLMADLDRRDAVNADIRDKLSVMKAMGFSSPAVRATLRDMRADPEARESMESSRALYRRVAGVKGPLFEDVLPQLTVARVEAVGRVAQQRPATIPAHRRLEQMVGLISDDVSGGGAQ